MFYGILIRMFFKDIERHHLAHIHAEYQGQVGTYSIPDGVLLAGELPPSKHKLVVAWIEIHKDDLLADWALAVDGKKPFPIKGGSMNIAELTPHSDWKFSVVANDGRTGQFDVRPYLEFEAFQELKDITQFMKIKNSGYFVEWECGADLSADTIEAKME